MLCGAYVPFRQGIGRHQLTIHADRGPADLGVTKTHAQPHVSNDNPFSEAQFKTLKYRPAFPKRPQLAEDMARRL